jgi:hypothetical protein
MCVCVCVWRARAVRALSRITDHPPASKSFFGPLFLLPLQARQHREMELLYVAMDMQWRVVSDPDSSRLTWRIYFIVVGGRLPTECWSSCV